MVTRLQIRTKCLGQQPPTGEDGGERKRIDDVATTSMTEITGVAVAAVAEEEREEEEEAAALVATGGVRCRRDRTRQYPDSIRTCLTTLTT